MGGGGVRGVQRGECIQKPFAGQGWKVREMICGGSGVCYGGRGGGVVAAGWTVHGGGGERLST